MTKLVSEVKDVLRTVAAKKQIQVKTEVEREVSEVLGDPSKVKQILYNYLSND